MPDTMESTIASSALMLATSYPELPVFFCGVAGVCGEMLVVLLSVISLALSFSRKTVRGSVRVSSVTMVLAMVAAILVMAALCLDPKRMSAESVRAAVGWIGVPAGIALVTLIWSHYRWTRLNSSGG